MFFAVNTFMWTRAFSEQDLPLLEQIKAWGADGVEFAGADAAHFPVDGVRRELERLGLRCTVCTSPPRVEQSIVHDDPVARAAGVAFLRDALGLASRLGAEVLAGPLYAPVAWFTGERPTQAQFDWAVEALQAIAPDLGQSGIDLALEPMNRFETFFLSTAAQGARLCEAVGHNRVGLMMDVAHMAIEEKDLSLAVRTAAPWLKHLQVSENDRGTPGSGTLIDWPGLFRTLHDIGYARGCAIESFAWNIPEIASRTWCWRDLAASPEALASEGLAFLRRTEAESRTRLSGRPANPCRT